MYNFPIGKLDSKKCFDDVPGQEFSSAFQRRLGNKATMTLVPVQLGYALYLLDTSTVLGGGRATNLEHIPC